MLDLIENGALTNLILALVALEAATLLALRVLFGMGPGLPRLAYNLAAGACLILALRAALSDHSPAWIALFLTGALIAHGLDLLTRWRETRQPG